MRMLRELAEKLMELAQEGGDTNYKTKVAKDYHYNDKIDRPIETRDVDVERRDMALIEDPESRRPSTVHTVEGLTRN